MAMKVDVGEEAPDIVNVFIEIPMDSSVKYEFDKEFGLIKVDRFLYTSMRYPFNYGFVPGTLEEDGDPVDVLLMSREPLYPGVLIEARPVGLLVMEDEEGKDSKVVAVPKGKLDRTYEGVNDVSDLPSAVLEKIKHFFEHYKELEPGKWVRALGWKGAEEAKEDIRMAINRYRNEGGPVAQPG